MRRLTATCTERRGSERQGELSRLAGASDVEPFLQTFITTSRLMTALTPSRFVGVRGGRHRRRRGPRLPALCSRSAGRPPQRPARPSAAGAPRAALRRSEASGPRTAPRRPAGALPAAAAAGGASPPSAGRRRGAARPSCGLGTRFPVTGRGEPRASGARGAGGRARRGTPSGLAGGRAGQRRPPPPGAAAGSRCPAAALLLPGRQRGGPPQPRAAARLRWPGGGGRRERLRPRPAPSPASPARPLPPTPGRGRGGKGTYKRAPLRACVTPPRRHGDGAAWRHTPREGRVGGLPPPSAPAGRPRRRRSATAGRGVLAGKTAAAAVGPGRGSGDGGAAPGPQPRSPRDAGLRGGLTPGTAGLEARPSLSNQPSVWGEPGSQPAPQQTVVTLRVRACGIGDCGEAG